MDKTYYFAYGSNANSKNMHKTCPSAQALGVSFLHDHKLSFMGNKGAAIACVTPSKGVSVPVVVWSLDKSEMGKLTNYVTLPYLYNKREVEIEFRGDGLKGFVYFPTLNLRASMPSEGYLNTLREAYSEHGIDINYLEVAIKEASGR